MKSVFRKIILSFILMMPLVVVAQDAQPKTEQSPATSRAKRKKAKQKWKEDRKMEMEQKKAIKEHHKRLQTKETRKRMKREKRKAEKLRANKKESRIVRWFKYR